MKILVEIQKKDTQGNDFENCNDCAITRAVRRVIKKEYRVTEGVNHITLYDNEEIGGFTEVPHQDFLPKDFDKLKDSPEGTVCIYEMDIPKKYLKITNPIVKEFENETTCK